MKALLITLTAISSLTLMSCKEDKATTDASNSADKTELKAEWHNLIADGNLSQWKPWRKYSIENVTAWTITDGVLHLSKSAENRNKGGSIITVKQYPNFEFKFEFKISEGGNSGIKYRSFSNLGLEYQILDDVSSRDNKNPLNSAASLYQLVAAPKTKKLKPVGEWNTGRIIANGNNIQHWLNGEKVVEIEIGSDEWNAAFEKSKYKKEKDFAKISAEILIQDHGDEVSFRNLLIKELK